MFFLCGSKSPSGPRGCGNLCGANGDDSSVRSTSRQYYHHKLILRIGSNGCKWLIVGMSTLGF